MSIITEGLPFLQRAFDGGGGESIVVSPTVSFTCFIKRQHKLSACVPGLL